MISRLEVLIDEYYNAKTFSPECIAEVVAFVQDTSTVREKNVEFTKRLTKVAYKIWESDNTLLDESLEKIYQFGCEGLERIARWETNNISTERVINLESHFHGYMGSIARAIADKGENKLKWLEKGHGHSKTAGDLMIKKDPTYASFHLIFARTTADKIFKITNNPIWLGEEYNLDLKVAETSKNIDKKLASHSYSLAAESAKKLYEITKDLRWAVGNYDLNKMSADIGKDTDPKYASYVYTFAGDAAKELWEKTRKKEWLEQWCTSYFDSGVVALTWNPKMAAKMFEKAAEIAHQNCSRLRGSPVIKLGIRAYQQVPEYSTIPHIRRNIADLIKYK